MALQLMLDFYGCDKQVINDLDQVTVLAHEAIRSIGAEVVEECSHTFDPIGITYIAVISTSHFSVHTWPEYGYAAVDIFSCNEAVPKALADRLARAMGAKKTVANQIERRIDEE